MRIAVYLDRQRLELIDDQGIPVASYVVSTARNGAGERYGSYCTPRGLHIVRAKVGAGCAPNTVFVRRRPTGEIWTPQLAREHPARDWMLTRILWLSGRESGFNRGGKVDSLRRKIYIHGAGDDGSLGVPSSHGCVRLSNADVIALYDRVNMGTAVDIVEDGAQPFTVRIVRWEAERARLESLRIEVFVVEQQVPFELEFDDDDPVCRHALALDTDGRAIGCARLLGDASIGRVAVLSAWRGRGVGGAMLARLMDVARYAGFEHVGLNARSDTQAFYERHGFIARGAEYIEVGIRHQRMERTL